jgi:uncharacterized 2Fe-2S/4Fe-4S cluster protein (DUF4445 family)
LVETLNSLVVGLCEAAGATPEQVVEAAVAGNTAMHHLFAGLPVQQLGAAPYVPVTGEALEAPAQAVGLDIALAATVYLPPNIAGYVGADHVAMLLAMDVAHAGCPTIALDIGTNTEITLSVPEKDGNRLLSCSCASGPAFEGAHIHAGMRAAPGAIERVRIVDGQVRAHTIGEQAPWASAARAFWMRWPRCSRRDPGPARRAAGDHALVHQQDGKKAFVLAQAEQTGTGQDLFVSREDVKEIQLAKGAIRAGIEILLAEGGLPAEAVEQFIIAGAFGTYLDLESAIRAGMFPNLPRQRFRQVGNAAGMGARLMLISAEQRRRAAEIARQVEYIELTTHPAFSNAFVKALVFETGDAVNG